MNNLEYELIIIGGGMDIVEDHLMEVLPDGNVQHGIMIIVV